MPIGAVDTWQEIERNYIIQGASGTPTVTASAGSDSDYPVNNLLTYPRWQKWRSGASGAQTLVFDLGSTSMSADAVSFHNTNHIAAAWTSVSWQHGTSSTGPWTTVATVDFSDAAAQTLSDSEDWWIHFSTVSTKRYWRLNIGGATDKPSIGVIVLGRSFEYQEGDHGGGNRIKWDFSLVERRGETGQRFISQVGRRRVTVTKTRTVMQFDNSSTCSPLSDLMDADRSDSNSTLNLHQGALRPFVYIPRPDGTTGDGTKGRCFYMRYPAVHEISEQQTLIFNDELEMTEEA